MEIVKGSIVRAKAGRDKGNYFVVLSIDDTYAYIADGKTRKVEKPKKKKLIHLEPTASVTNETFETNRKIKQAFEKIKSS